MDISNINQLEVNVLEYCTVVEKTYLPTDQIKVTIPKLNINTNKGVVRADASILVNDPECKPIISGPIKLEAFLIVKTFSGLELSKSCVRIKKECGCYVSNHVLIRDCLGDEDTFIDGHIVEAYIPKGAKMIVCFMDGNINDGYLTNFI